jgi:hypothetical protein
MEPRELFKKCRFPGPLRTNGPAVGPWEPAFESEPRAPIQIQVKADLKGDAVSGVHLNLGCVT